MSAAEHLGPAAASVITAAKDAFMSGMSSAAIVAAIIIGACSLLAFFGLPKHTAKDDDVI